ncbi:MAG TPA: biopolymer transporter ExbD [Armatimonadota bacterium]|nr:biopolymer transporter ExbD [Armatimonadota bacterium]
MRLKRWEPKRARIEIVPMIDTIFFLLVFFMIASLAMTTMRGMPVNLPKSSTAGDRSSLRTVITITETGKYYMDKRLVRFDDVRPILSVKLKENPRLGVIINCDKRQNWGKGIEVMDEARQAGAENLTIATEPKTEKR